MDDNSNGEVLNYWYVNGGEFQSGCFFQLQCLGVSWLGCQWLSEHRYESKLGGFCHAPRKKSICDGQSSSFYLIVG